MGDHDWFDTNLHMKNLAQCMAQNLGLVEPSTAAWTHAINEETYLLGQEETQKVITEFVSTKTQQNEQTTQILCHGEL
jgi:hypothetical protein